MKPHPSCRESFKRIIRYFLFLTCATKAFSYSILHQSADTWVVAGNKTTLYCNFDEPSESCSWNRNGIGVDFNSFRNHYKLTANEEPSKEYCNLTIHNVSLEVDGGNWQCFLPRKSEVKPGLISTPINLIVLVTPSQPVIRVGRTTSKNLTIADGDTLQISCETWYGHPSTNFTWQLENFLFEGNLREISDNKNVNYTTTASFLQIDVNQELHNADITCFAQHGKNLFNTSARFDVQYETSHVNLTKVGEFVVSIGADIHIKCLANGNPLPTTTWKVFRTNEHKWETIGRSEDLKLKVDESTPGRYLCQAGNTNNVELSPELIIILNDDHSEDSSVSIIAAAVGSIAVVLTAATIGLLYARRRIKKSYRRAETPSPTNKIQLHDRPLPKPFEFDRPLPKPTEHDRPLPKPTEHDRPLPKPTEHNRPLARRITSDGYLIPRSLLPPSSSECDYIEQDDLSFPSTDNKVLQHPVNDTEKFQETEECPEYENQYVENVTRANM